MRDSEQSYHGWTLDVFRNEITCEWIADCWYPGSRDNLTVRGGRRKDVIAEAKSKIEELMKAKQRFFNRG